MRRSAPARRYHVGRRRATGVRAPSAPCQTGRVSRFDAVVVGAGPNGLAAAVTLARAGLSVRVYERSARIGGGARTAELTLPGYLHDVCSAIHPMAFASDFFRRFGLTRRIPFVTPELAYGHPLDGGGAALAYRSLERTAEALGPDGPAWRGLFEPLVRRSEALAELSGGPLLRFPRDPSTFVRFGLRVLEQGGPAWDLRWRGEAGPALLTGVMAHAILRLPSLGTAATGLGLATFAHAAGWPVPIGGSQAIVDALADDLCAHGGEILAGRTVDRVEELPPARAVLFDTSARALVRLTGTAVPPRARQALLRQRLGNGASKVDFALSGPVPWANPALAAAGTVHVGGSRAQLAEAENEVARGRHAPRPYVLVAQPSTFDPTRTPDDGHTLWTYSHVPRGSTVDQTEAITAQIERFAPGFRDVVVASSSRTAADLEAYDPNYIGGDISSGAGSFAQLVARPRPAREPWRLPGTPYYLCSSAAAPGPGVHGLAGWHAARSALRHEFGILRAPDLSPEAEPASALDPV